jgi:hypothetical protein
VPNDHVILSPGPVISKKILNKDLWSQEEEEEKSENSNKEEEEKEETSEEDKEESSCDTEETQEEDSNEGDNKDNDKDDKNSQNKKLSIKIKPQKLHWSKHLAKKEKTKEGSLDAPAEETYNIYFAYVFRVIEGQEELRT